jgi:serine/threonine protein kinase
VDHPARRRFRVMKEIAEGGFGKVYLAEMISGDFSTVVVLKLLHGKWADHKEIVQRSRDEARVLGRLRHPNIVRVDDLTSIQGQCAVVMEYVEGVNLKVLLKWLAREGVRFPMKAAFEVIGDVADALDAAYNSVPLQESRPLHLVHRDVKPSNIMIGANGHVKLLDFGTAQAQFDTRESKTEAMTFGSKGYIPPERLLREPDGPPGDVFALGVMLYWMLSGEQLGEFPLRPTRYAEWLDVRVKTMDLSRIRDPDLRDNIRNVLSLILTYDPEARPSSAQMVELCEILGESVGGQAIRPFCRRQMPPIMAAYAAFQSGKGGELVGEVLLEDRTSSMPLPPEAPPIKAGLAMPHPALATFSELPPAVMEGLEPLDDEQDEDAPQLPAAPVRRERKRISSDELASLPLSQKLKQDVSVGAIAAVLKHEIRFGRKKAPSDQAPSPQPDLAEDDASMEVPGDTAEVMAVAAAEADSPTDPTLARKANLSVDDILSQPLGDDDLPVIDVPPEKRPPTAEELHEMTFSQKLKQDVSMASLKAVLKHDIRLFGGKKKR